MLSCIRYTRFSLSKMLARSILVLQLPGIRGMPSEMLARSSPELGSRKPAIRRVAVMDGINQGSLPVFAPQGLFGGLLGSVVGGLGGGALGGLLGNRNLGQQIGNVAGSVLGGLLPFGVDSQQYLQAQQIAAQGLFMDGFAPQPIQSL